jgi:hypothetical protein
LKLTDGYEADGWLGLLLGTSLWYAFYGSTLSSESAFESRVESLVRELGARGQRDAVVVADNGGRTASEPEPHQQDSLDNGKPQPLAQLGCMRVAALQRRAISEGVDVDAVEEALDQDNPKAALIDLLSAVGGGR